MKSHDHLGMLIDELSILGKIYFVSMLKKIKTLIPVPVSELFSDPEELELELSALGINNTNFWSLAAPRIHAGYLQFKPVLIVMHFINCHQITREKSANYNILGYT